MYVLVVQRCAEMQPEEVRIVKGVDERLTGEAYVHISGARSKLRLALAKDRTLMPVRLLHTMLVSHMHLQADMQWQAPQAFQCFQALHIELYTVLHVRFTYKSDTCRRCI
jgi:hypothetical protein